MTKSTITRERLEQLANFKGAPVTRQEEQELARMALAAMDSEPVAWTWHYREQWHVTNDKCRAEFVAKDGDVAVLPLYRHAQPATVVSTDLFHTAASAIEDLLTTKDRAGAGVWFDLPFRLRSAANAQPAPGVPDGYVMVPKEPTDEMLAAAKERTGLTSTAEVVYIKMLAAAPQSPGSEPATVPGKWIPVSEHLPKEKGVYQVWNGKYVDNVPFWFGSFQSLHSELITHWMPLPAAPQEVNHG